MFLGGSTAYHNLKGGLCVITQMEVFSAQDDAPALPMGGFGPNDDPIQVRNIDGLGPVKADITTTPFASGRGALYQGSTVGTRNIVLSLGLNPDFVTYPSMLELRRILYRYLLPTAWTKLRFYTEELPPVEIEGYVESFEPNMFSDDPEIQVSIICPNPDFIDPTPNVLNGTVTEFADDGVEFEYIGSVPAGLEMTVTPSESNPSFTGEIIVVMGPPPETVFAVSPVTIDATHSLRIATWPAKKVESIESGFLARTNLLADVTADSVWPIIRVGSNKIVVNSDADFGQLWEMAYFTRFGGL